ncbi:MAG: CoA ester lyase [Pseudomonadota bacterium]
MTFIRSFLFVPAASEKMLGKIDGSDADAVILDLEDAVVESQKPKARELAAEYLTERPAGSRQPQIWVRVNAIGSSHWDADLNAILQHEPDGIVLPKAEGPDDVEKLAGRLDAARLGPDVKILAIATETAAAPFRLGDYANAKLDRLYGMTWGAEDLSAALGASTNIDGAGRYRFTYELVRSLCLMGARAAGVEPIEGVFTDFRDLEGLAASCQAAREDGFVGRLAIHPAQVPIINNAFTPGADEIDHAHAVVAAFDASPGAGAVSLDGRMLDIPHLTQARAIIARSKALSQKTEGAGA